MEELSHMVSLNGAPAVGKNVAVIDAYHFTERSEHASVEESVLHLKQCRHLAANTLIVEIATASHGKGAAHHHLLESVHTVYLSVRRHTLSPRSEALNTCT